jgi:hypothetical protein
MKTTRTAGGCILAAMTVLAGAGRAAEPTTRPAAASPREQRLAKLITAVADADDPFLAASSYSRGNAMSPDSVLLHETYMKRMLRFGLIKIALYPAQTLIRLEPDHALAWAVMGYTHGRKGELPRALAATIRAVAALRDDPSVLNNAGQLVAWYDNEADKPDIHAAVRRLLADMRADLAGREQYGEAYARITEAYKKRSAAAAEYEKKLPPAQAAVRSLREQLAELEAHYRGVQEEIASRRRLIDSLEHELYYYHWYVDDVYGDYYRYRRVRRAELRDRIREEQRVVDQLLQQAEVIRARGVAVQRELAEREKALAALRAEQERSLARIHRLFRWDPPAVNGVVTPVVESIPEARRQRPPLPPDPEVVAAQRLKVAQLYLRHKMPQKAREILLEIVAKYASTEAAAPAEAMLAQMREPS